jgi:glycosyltransferase involved in cell wall biosynthesis
MRASSAGVAWVPNGLDSVWANRLVAGSRSVSAGHAALTNIVLYSRFAEFSSDWLPRYVSALSSCLRPDEFARLVVIGSVEIDHIGTTNVMLEYMGYVAHDSLPPLLGRADIAIYPYHDSLISRSKNSVKLLELMAAGCAVVAAGIGDVPAVGGDTVTQMHSSEPQAFAAATLELMRDPQLRQQKAAAAQKRVVESFTVSAVTQRLAAPYRQFGLTVE